MAIGDVNGDGKPDMAVANSVSSTENYSVSVLLGNGDGTFGSAVNFATGSYPVSVAIGDVNGDGKPDLVVANNFGNSVSVLLGVGNGTFGAAATFAVGSSPRSVAIRDVNGDGKPDLVVANFGGNVSVLLGTGTGSFGAATNFATGTQSESVAIGDVNGDGKPDLVVANAGSGNVSVLLGNGDGTFGAATNFTAGTAPASVAIGDVNGDGKLDIITANFGSSNMSVLLGVGDGTFEVINSFLVGTNPFSVAVGDINGDGKPDIVTANFGSNNVSVLLGNGTGTTFTADTSLAVGSSPRDVVMADINGDGKPDLAVANGNYSSTTVSVLLGGGAVVIDLSVTATSVATTEGAAFSGRVATFCDGSNTDPIGNFTATIHWGDSTSDTAGTVSQPGGIGTAYVVAASGTPHTYAEEGPYTFSVTITDTDETSNTASNTGTATVADAALTGSSAATAGGTEGILNSSVLSGATFTDANPGDHSAEMSATINWKDTQTSIGTVSYLDGVYTVHGAHTYAEEGSFGFSIDVVDAGGSGTTITGTATVADAALTAGTLTPPAATEGARFNDVVVFHFTDADPGGAVGDYLATVNTGDVTLNNVFNPTQVAIVANGEGGFDVLLSYNYLEELTGATFSVTVTDNAATTSQSIDTFSVADAALTANNFSTPRATEGAPFTSRVFTFSDADTAGAASDFTAVVVLGDGNTVTLTSTASADGQIVGGKGGAFDVFVTHTYLEELTGQTFSVTVTDHFSQTSASTSTFSVADAALTGGTQAAAGGTENATNSSVLSAATFTDANPGDNHAEMTATINWGDDGDTSPGTVSFAGGVYTVNGTHTYAEEGSHGLSISVVDNGGSVATISGTATVADAALTANSFTPPVAIEGAPVDGTVFNFSDADPNGTVSDYTAVVVLGDGTTVTLTSVPSSDGQIVANGVTFDVQLSHTYLEELTGQTFRVTVTDNASQAGAATTTFSVADAALTMNSFTPPSATEGIPIGGGPRGFFFLPFGATVFNFSDADPSGTVSDYTAVIVLGDGNTAILTSTRSADGQIVANGRTFDVNLTHTYLEEMTGQTFSVTVTDHFSQTSASTSTFSVADAPLTTNSFTPPVATEGCAIQRHGAQLQRRRSQWHGQRLHGGGGPGRR